MRRVVVTGLGCVSPVGNSVEETWNSIKAGKSGIATITHYDNTNFKVKYAAEVKNFKAEDYMDGKAARKMALYTKYLGRHSCLPWRWNWRTRSYGKQHEVLL